MAGAGGYVAFDPVAVSDAITGIHAIASDAHGIRRQCAAHQQRAHDLLDALRQHAIMELDPAARWDIWGALGFGGLRSEIGAARDGIERLLSRANSIQNTLFETHKGTLGSKLHDEMAPLCTTLASSHYQAKSALALIEDIVGLFLGGLELPLTLGGIVIEIDRTLIETDTLTKVFDWLHQQENNLINLVDSSIRDLWGSKSSAPPLPAPVTSPPPQQPPASGSDLVVAEALKLAGGLQKGSDGVYNSYLTSSGANTYTGDPKIAALVFPKGGKEGDWSWTDIQCVAFVWLVFAEAYPKTWQSILRIGGDGGDPIWNNYRNAIQANTAPGWSQIDNGQPPKPGDIMVIEYRDANGKDIFGHVAIVTSAPPKGPLMIAQGNTPSKTQTITMSGGSAVMSHYFSNYYGKEVYPVVLGYLRYTPPPTP